MALNAMWKPLQRTLVKIACNQINSSKSKTTISRFQINSTQFIFNEYSGESQTIPKLFAWIIQKKNEFFFSRSHIKFWANWYLCPKLYLDVIAKFLNKNWHQFIFVYIFFCSNIMISFFSILLWIWILSDFIMCSDASILYRQKKKRETNKIKFVIHFLSYD